MSQNKLVLNEPSPARATQVKNVSNNMKIINNKKFSLQNQKNPTQSKIHLRQLVSSKNPQVVLQDQEENLSILIFSQREFKFASIFFQSRITRWSSTLVYVPQSWVVRVLENISSIKTREFYMKIGNFKFSWWLSYQNCRRRCGNWFLSI